MPSAFTMPVAATDCAVLVVPLHVLPFVLGAMGNIQDRQYWETDQDWYAAVEALAEVEAMSAKTCISELIESNNRIYRLIDAAMFGRTYQLLSTDPVVTTPAVTAVPDLTAVNPGLVARLALVEKALDNALNGTIYNEFPNSRAMRTQLEDILTAIQSDDADIATIVQDLSQLLILLA